MPDFVKRFFVSCSQISEAYAVRTLRKFGSAAGKSVAKAGAGKTLRGHIMFERIKEDKTCSQRKIYTRSAKWPVCFI